MESHHETTNQALYTSHYEAKMPIGGGVEKLSTLFPILRKHIHNYIYLYHEQFQTAM